MPISPATAITARPKAAKKAVTSARRSRVWILQLGKLTLQDNASLKITTLIKFKKILIIMPVKARTTTVVPTRNRRRSSKT